MTLGNVNAAPLTFRALFLENSRLSMPSLVERVQLHYQEQMMAQIYRVLGSADFLGNPVGLFNNISSGFSDIFYEPYQGIVMHGNKDIGLGIARVSLLKSPFCLLLISRVLRASRRRLCLVSPTR